MLDFAMKVCIDSAAVGDADFAALRAHGFSDDDAWDIAGITALFGLSNRMANVTSMRPNDEFYLMGRVPPRGSVTAAPAALQRLARHAVTQPVEPPVPNDDEGLLARKGPWRLAFRAARRRVEVAASGQAALELTRIDPAWRRAIWFHPEMPQIGDSLLDLAPRSLLVEHGIAVDVVLPRSTGRRLSRRPLVRPRDRRRRADRRQRPRFRDRRQPRWKGACAEATRCAATAMGLGARRLPRLRLPARAARRAPLRRPARRSP